MHLFSIGLTYATNWQRSAIEDRALVWLQPYLIGTNWYQEMMPIEWISENYRPGSFQLSIQHANATDQWVPILGVTSTNSMRAKFDRLLHVLSELARGEDYQGMTRVLKSIVLHLEKSRPANAPQISKIRLEKIAASSSIGDSEEVLYEATLARFPSGEFGFVPKIENHRSVRAIETHGVKP